MGVAGMMLSAGAVFVLAMLGWWLASIPGLLLGTVMGVWLDRHLGPEGWAALRSRLTPPRKVASQPDGTMLQFMLLGHLAKLNGRVLPAHIQQARIEMRRLGLEGYPYQAAIAAFNQGKTMELAGMRRGLQKGFAGLAAEQLLLSGWRLVWAQGRASREQYEVMKLCAGWLSVKTERLLQLEQQVKPAPKVTGGMKVRLSERDRALQLLGLKPPVDDFAVVRRAYRRLLSEHHPDRLIGMGASAEQVQRANDKTSALHEAYSLLRQYYRAR
ncbi:MAG: molecular chaperone DjlA [Gammaproteobacteria bacterium]|nr:molecular chaperone DjlA [Gammaproteobacteria bacterium]